MMVSSSSPHLSSITALCFFFLFVSSAIAACDRCVHKSKVAFFAKASALPWGACGYGTSVMSYYGKHLAAAAPSILKNGSNCGACFQIRCKNKRFCSEAGTKIIATDLNANNQTDFVLTSIGFRAMAKPGRDHDLLNVGIVQVEYKRVPCEYKQNLGFRVEEASKNPHYLAIKLLFQGGQTEITHLAAAKAGTGNWSFLSHNNGAIWDTSKVPRGALDFTVVVTSGKAGKSYLAKDILPANWTTGVVYDTGLKIADIAQEVCSPCDNGGPGWKS